MAPIPKSAFNPPAQLSAAGARRPSSVLLDHRGYIADRENATTAECHTRHGGLIKVTFCIAEPPRISYFCMHTHGGDRFEWQPTILAAEGRFVLFLAIILPGNHGRAHCDYNHYYIYEASSSRRRSEKPPSLRLLPNTLPSLLCQVLKLGILPIPTHKGLSYLIAGLHPTSSHHLYTLMLFDPGTWQWITKDVRAIDLPPSTRIGLADKVITIGGKAGSMGWVDLWQGILVCDLFCKNHVLRYVPLPALEVRNEARRFYASSCRDILATEGRIRYFELRFKIRPPSSTSYADISGDFNLIAATWSTKGDDSWNWHNDSIVDDVADIPIDSQKHSDFLPNRQDNEAEEPSLKGLCLGAPALSLQVDNLVYLVAKVDFWDRSMASVLAIDMGKKTLEGVAEFAAERALGLRFTYLQSKVSKYLDINNSSRFKSNAAQTVGDGIAQGGKQEALKPKAIDSGAASGKKHRKKKHGGKQEASKPMARVNMALNSIE